MISIVVPSSGSASSVRHLCDSILQQKVSEELEVYIVANPDSKEIRSLLAEYPARFHYLSSGRGANCARNAGLKATRGRFVFFFDDDCILPSADFLARGISYLNQHPACMGYGGTYRPYQKSLSIYDTAYCYIQNKWLLEGVTSTGESLYLIGGNMMLRRELFTQYGLFSENLAFGGTETELFSRMENVRLDFDADRFVWHNYQLSYWTFLRKGFLQGVGSSYIRKFHPGWKRSEITYGKSAVLNKVELNSVSDRALQKYKWAFFTGDLFYQKNKRTKMSRARISWELFRSQYFQNKNRFRHTLDDILCIVENIRNKYAGR